MASNDGGSPLSSPLPEDFDGDSLCNICEQKYCQPRILSCLHVFCEQCLNKLLLDKPDEENGDSPSGVIICPDCQQDTKVSKHGASSLHPDYLYCNSLDSNAIDNQQIVCTSCKTKKVAVARCSDCANFLCPSCVTAHKYMRCFENHKVESFKDLDPSVQKPIDCPSHVGEALKYFCHNCQFPICNECLLSDHKPPEHQYESIGDAEQKQKDELKNLMSESKSKVQFCEEASGTLESLLSELQIQHDSARSHIEETCQTYKACIDKIKDAKLKELQTVHSTQELTIMDTFHSVEKTIEKIEDACKFTTRLLEKGSITEILLLKSIVGSQLLYLINNTPKPEVTVCLEFQSNEEKFQKAAQELFGSFKKSEPTKDNIPLSSLHSSFDSEAFVLPTGVLTPEGTSAAPPNVELPASTFSEFTLSQLASLAADMTQSPTSPLSLADIISTDSLVNTSNINTLNNLTALAKLGSASLSNHDQLLLNGQVVPGLNLDGSLQTHQSQSDSPPNSLQTPQLTSALEAASALGALLNGGLPSPHSMSSRGPSPLLDGSSLLNGGASTQLNGPLSSVLASTLLGNRGDLIQNLGVQPGFSTRNSAAKLNPVKIRYKFGQLGPGKGQFSSPHGFCLGVEEEIVVADTNNHRIQVFEKTGDFKYQFGIPGKEEGQLWYPRKVAVMRNSGKFVVCDRGNERSRMQIFTKNGHFIKKIAIRYIDIVAGLAITNQGYIVAVDSVSPTVFIISESGDLLRWFDCSDYMREPSDIAINGKEYFVCDFKGHCVVVFNEDGQFMRRIGCENITNYPNGIDISDAGDVLVGDSHGNRFHVAVFSRDGSLLSEFECPYVKVSRCCGLKITSEGYVVTLAKNNHHVLILNTLYII